MIPNMGMGMPTIIIGRRNLKKKNSNGGFNNFFNGKKISNFINIFFRHG